METHKAVPMGMDHPAVMAGMQATVDGHLLALHGVLLGNALLQTKDRTRELFGEAITQDAVAVRVCVAYAVAGVLQ